MRDPATSVYERGLRARRTPLRARSRYPGRAQWLPGVVAYEALHVDPETGEIGKVRRLTKEGTPRALGTNPRAKGTNPRAKGTNPRAGWRSPRQREVFRLANLSNLRPPGDPEASRAAGRAAELLSRAGGLSRAEMARWEATRAHEEHELELDRRWAAELDEPP